MKKFIILITFIFIFFGCRKEDNSVIVPETANYQVLSVNTFQDFQYFPGDSTKAITITFNSLESVTSVSYNVTTPESKNLYSFPQTMIKGPNSYSARLAMSKDYQNGDYTIRYYVSDITGNTKIAALHKFRFNNGFANSPPVISNALVSPDSIDLTDLPVLTVTVEAADPDGSNDIEVVYFISIRPDGTTSGTQNILNDDGIQTGGVWDDIAGDGIYSMRFAPLPTTTKGTWTFQFRARDRSKALSNIISYNVIIR
jgi:hypothetical protein